MTVTVVFKWFNSNNTQIDKSIKKQEKIKKQKKKAQITGNFQIQNWFPVTTARPFQNLM